MENYLSSNLRYLRKLHSKTQADLALEVNKGQTTIGNWETGLSEPNNTELIILSNFFGVTVDDILKEDLSKGNLIAKQVDTKNRGKGNLKGNPKGNLNTRNSTVPGIKKGSGGLSESLSLLQSLMQEQQDRQQAINTHLTGILTELAAAN